MIAPTFSVSECIAVINQTLEYAYSSVVVEGEVASYKVNQGKFVFFDLKDSTGIIQCFSMVWQMRTPLEDGMRVAVRAVPKLTQKGRFSLTIQEATPLGEGAIARSFELLKAKLEKEGLFAEERKRFIPTIPKSIAVISSIDAAGYGDFIKILDDRWGGIDIDVAHVQVQGEAAEKQLIRALEYFNQRELLPDVIVIVRGGGSAEDLQTFNTEPLVRAIAASRVPVMTGVGHEQDITLADLVADVRASTPSNAAERLVPDKRDVVRSSQLLVLQIATRAERYVQSEIEMLRERLIGALDGSLRRIDDAQDVHQQQSSLLGAYDPMRVLSRGYAILKGDARVGATISIETKQHNIRAEVTHVGERI